MAKKTRNTRGRIVSAAWKLFYEQGYEDTTVEEIIEQSHTPKGSFYHHFECAAYLYDTDCIPDIEADFQNTLTQCTRVTWETLKKEPFSRKLTGFLMKSLSPLM